MVSYAVPPDIDAFYAPEVFVPENDNIIINCSATGYPPPSLQWTRNGMEITNERFTINDIKCSSDCLVDARVTSSLIITNASMSDIDMYTCTAMNILGEVDASLNLTVQCKLRFTFIPNYVRSYSTLILWNKNQSSVSQKLAHT